jgi:hypothetical protein
VVPERGVGHGEIRDPGTGPERTQVAEIEGVQEGFGEFLGPDGSSEVREGKPQAGGATESSR